MNLPHLDFNPYDYAEYAGQVTDGYYRMIPFADWLPPDFEDVLCSRGGAFKLMYFSPATGMMVPSETECASEALEPSQLTIWLKKI